MADAYGFDQKDVERISRVVQDVESGIASGPGRGKYGNYAGPPAQLAKTPAGGLAACTGSGPYSFGSATCTVVDNAGSTGTVGSRTLTVYNMSSTAVGANKLIQINWINKQWFAHVESC